MNERRNQMEMEKTRETERDGKEFVKYFVIYILYINFCQCVSCSPARARLHAIHIEESGQTC